MTDLTVRKEQIEKFVHINRRKNIHSKEFLMCYYVYLALYCSRKYTLSEELCDFVGVQPDCDPFRLSELFQDDQTMNVVVSVQ